MDRRLVILDTSQRNGFLALALGAEVLGVRPLDEARRHARDLAPSLHDLLSQQAWKARDLEGVLVGRGPGSYTGLRVGIMSAKTLAYAVGCPLLGIDTFAAIARQAPDEAKSVEVIADAQQEKIYRQRFRRDKDDWRAETGLEIVPFAEWHRSVRTDDWVSGPAVAMYAERIAAHVAPEDLRLPKPESMLALGLVRLERGERHDPFALEPHYLRPSSAEENFRRVGP